MRPDRDIRIFLFIGYAFAYPLAVVPPIFIDPRLTDHSVYGARTYPDAVLCIPIGLGLLAFVGMLFCRNNHGVKSLYGSVLLFAAAIIISLPVFRPELPHGNLVQVGLTMSFFSGFTAFIWTISNQIVQDATLPTSPGEGGLDYLKLVFAFVRQAAFAGIALFGALFYGAFTVDFKYNEMIVSGTAESLRHDTFLLNMNVALQIGFYAIYSIFGPIRYFFLLNVRILAQLKSAALAIDNTKRAQSPPSRTTQINKRPIKTGIVLRRSS